MVEIIHDGNVQGILTSYKKYGWKPIEIYTLSREYDVVLTTVEKHILRSNSFEEMTQVVHEETIGLVSNA